MIQSAWCQISDVDIFQNLHFEGDKLIQIIEEACGMWSDNIFVQPIHNHLCILLWKCISLYLIENCLSIDDQTVLFGCWQYSSRLKGICGLLFANCRWSTQYTFGNYVLLVWADSLSMSCISLGFSWQVYGMQWHGWLPYWVAVWSSGWVAAGWIPRLGRILVLLVDEGTTLVTINWTSVGMLENRRYCFCDNW